MKTGRKGRNETIKRMLRLIQRLQGMRYAPSFDSLADELGVTKRTIYRDFEVLESIGHPLPRYRINGSDGREAD